MSYYGGDFSDGTVVRVKADGRIGIVRDSEGVWRTEACGCCSDRIAVHYTVWFAPGVEEHFTNNEDGEELEAA